MSRCFCFAILLALASLLSAAVAVGQISGGGPSQYETISVMNAPPQQQNQRGRGGGLPGVPDPEHMANMFDSFRRSAAPSYLETNSRRTRYDRRRERRGRYNQRLSQQLNLQASSPYQRQVESNSWSSLETGSQTRRNERFRRAEERQRAIRVASRRSNGNNNRISNDNNAFSYIEESSARRDNNNNNNNNNNNMMFRQQNNNADDHSSSLGLAQSASMVAKVRAFKVFTHVGAAFLESFIQEESGSSGGDDNTNSNNDNNNIPQFDASLLNSNARRRMARERRRGFATLGRRRPREQGRLGSQAYEEFSALQVDQQELTGPTSPHVVQVLTLEPVTVELEINSEKKKAKQTKIKKEKQRGNGKEKVIESLRLMTIPSFEKKLPPLLLEKKSAAAQKGITVTSTKTVTKTTSSDHSSNSEQTTKQDLQRLSQATMFAASPQTTTSSNNDNNRMRFNSLPSSVVAENIPAPVSRFQELENSRQARYQQYKDRSKPRTAQSSSSSVAAAAAAAVVKHEYKPENHHQHRRTSYDDGQEMRFTELDSRVKADADSQAKAQTATKVRTGIFSSIVGFVRKMMGGGGQEGSRNKAAQFEDCVGCRFVWGEVEMDVGSARYIEDVQASFEHNCMDAQKSTIFYAVCEDMYDDMYAMTDDYMSNKFNIEKMCQRGMFCKS